MVRFRNPAPRLGDKRQPEGEDERSLDYLRGQQILANAIFHWRDDSSEDARAAVRFLMNHLATSFRADDSPLRPREQDQPSPAS